MKAISDFTGRQIASAFVADEKKGIFSWKDNAAAAAIRAEYCGTRLQSQTRGQESRPTL